MQDGVRGTSKSHIRGDGVIDGLLSEDVAGTDIFLNQFHDLHAGMFGQYKASGVRSRDGTVSAEAHAHDLGKAVHGVGRVHSGAGAAGRAGLLLILGEFLLCDFAGGIGANGFKHAGETGLMAIHMAGEHGTTADKDGRQVQSGRCHKKAGYVFVTVWNHNEAVKAMGLDHALGGVSNKITGDEGILHALMAHGNTVTDRNCREDNGGAACLGYADADCLRDFIKIHVARDNLIIGADDTDQRTAQLFLGETQGIVERTVRCIVKTVYNSVFDHNYFLLIAKEK